MPIRVVAAAIIEDRRVLVARRAPDMARPGLWELPGGKVEAGETDADALVRELEEELGITIEVGAPLGEAAHAYPDVTITLAGYACRLVRGQPVAREHDQLRWVRASELQELTWAPADLPLLAPLEGALGG